MVYASPVTNAKGRMMSENPSVHAGKRPIYTACDEKIYGETPEDGMVAKVYSDPELATMFAAAPELLAACEAGRATANTIIQNMANHTDLTLDQLQFNVEVTIDYLTSLLANHEAAIAKAEGDTQ